MRYQLLASIMARGSLVSPLMRLCSNSLNIIQYNSVKRYFFKLFSVLWRSSLNIYVFMCRSSVADPGSGALLTPGSEIRDG
jgi:hypothetical protein